MLFCFTYLETGLLSVFPDVKEHSVLSGSICLTIAGLLCYHDALHVRVDHKAKDGMSFCLCIPNLPQPLSVSRHRFCDLVIVHKVAVRWKYRYLKVFISVLLNV